MATVLGDCKNRENHGFNQSRILNIHSLGKKSGSITSFSWQKQISYRKADVYKSIF
jgi:hypothetical protein